MSNPATPMIPTFLSVGEIVSLSFRLYRHYFSTYTNLLKQHKGKTAGLFTRLVFCELRGKQEPVEVALEQSETRTKLYNLTYQQMVRKLTIQALLVGVPVLVVGGIFLLILSELLVLWLGYDLKPLLEQAYPVFFVLGGFGLAAASNRFYLVVPAVFLELDLQNVDSVLNRTASLTKRSSRRVFATILLAMLTIWPLSVPYFACTSLFLFLLAADQATALSTLLYDIISVVGFFLINILWGRVVAPLHLILKTVLYCDLRAREEGIDLKLASR